MPQSKARHRRRPSPRSYHGDHRPQRPHACASALARTHMHHPRRTPHPRSPCACRAPTKHAINQPPAHRCPFLRFLTSTSQKPRHSNGAPRIRNQSNSPNHPPMRQKSQNSQNLRRRNSGAPAGAPESKPVRTRLLNWIERRFRCRSTVLGEPARDSTSTGQVRRSRLLHGEARRRVTPQREVASPPHRAHRRFRDPQEPPCRNGKIPCQIAARPVRLGAHRRKNPDDRR
ncbi:hypothetical protein SAMN05216215_101439 [Saccharopolyspora shandongensis]|uniref:Uncharacterized protein n=1 Tax=Saccharopolyspora shandongensis TaxID=418495 RepID=A0A1H3DZJ5_9PSEU|nr:hypothetical protein SAMN05216215_101439 [Saccharopolyspora shandongensis]